MMMDQDRYRTLNVPKFKTTLMIFTGRIYRSGKDNKIPVHECMGIKIQWPFNAGFGYFLRPGCFRCPAPILFLRVPYSLPAGLYG